MSTQNSNLPPGVMHPNHPVASAPEDDERGWRRLSIGEPVRSYSMVYAFYPRPHWRLSSYFGAEKLINDGKSQYRNPASFWAWLSISIPLLSKLARGYWRLVWNGKFV